MLLREFSRTARCAVEAFREWFAVCNQLMALSRGRTEPGYMIWTIRLLDWSLCERGRAADLVLRKPVQTEARLWERAEGRRLGRGHRGATEGSWASHKMRGSRGTAVSEEPPHDSISPGL